MQTAEHGIGQSDVAGRRDDVNEPDLLAQIALRDLIMRYCRGCDRRDFALVRSLYHDDAIDDHGALFRGGPDEFVAWLPQAMEPWELTIHSVTNSLFAVNGNHAEGEHYVRAWHRPTRQTGRSISFSLPTCSERPGVRAIGSGSQSSRR